MKIIHGKMQRCRVAPKTRAIEKIALSWASFKFLLTATALALNFWGASHAVWASPITALIPSRYSIETREESAASKKNAGKNVSANKSGRAQSGGEADMLMALLEPWDLTGHNMEMPQLFAALYYPENFEPGKMQPELRNLLGDVEEIRYLNKKAWGANVDMEQPGLYQFLLETRPWWDEKAEKYLVQQVKVVAPSGNGAKGWATAFGQSFEILPLTRPFGLTAPALFSARVLLDGKPLADLPVHMGRLNMDNARVNSRWQKELEARSDANGQFAFTLSAPGWWYCAAEIPGAPLKGPDGEMRDVARSTVFWLYVDGQLRQKGRK